MSRIDVIGQNGNDGLHYVQDRVAKALKFMKFAEAAASLSKDVSTQVGAVALDDLYNIVAVGYNGPPRGVQDLPERQSRPSKYFFSAHAESNLVAQSAYSGRSLAGSTILVTPLHPCAHCAKMLIQAGAKRLICHVVPNERWTEESDYSKIMLYEAGVEVIYVEKVNRPGGAAFWAAVSYSPGGGG